MNKKVASILCYCSIIPWLIAYFSYQGDKKDIGKNLKQGLLLAIFDCIFIVQIVSIVFSIMAIIKIAKNEDEAPDVPLISSWNIHWFQS